MKNYLNKLSTELLDLITKASDMADKSNMPAYLVGGFVRDLMLGKKNLDLDIVVEGDGIRFAEELAVALGAGIIRHARFCTATILISADSKIDIATSRRESYSKPASLPVVQKGGLKDDLARRDFSINAMAISINKTSFGKLIDFFGGSLDLSLKKIRVLHSKSFIDDPTRILRAVRFEQRYDFRIEPLTLKYLGEAQKIKILEKVQPQRLREELILLLKEKSPLRNIRRLGQLSGFSFMHRSLRTAHKNFALLTETRKQINWFERKFPKYRKLDNWIIYFMAFLDGASVIAVNSICKKFVFRKGETKRILSYKRISTPSVDELSRPGISPDRVFSLLEPLSYEVIILLRGRHKNSLLRKHIAEFLQIYNGMRIYISGEDLQGLGLKPGPYYKQLFAKVLNAKLNGLVDTAEEELKMIKSLIRDKTS